MQAAAWRVATFERLESVHAVIGCNRPQSSIRSTMERLHSVKARNSIVERRLLKKRHFQKQQNVSTISYLQYTTSTTKATCPWRG